MRRKIPRVAFFTDSYHEVNGVALTSRKFAEFARAQGYPFFSCHAGAETKYWADGELETFEIGSSRFMIGLEKDLVFDPAFMRHLRTVEGAVERFRPDLIHITGPNHCSILGATIARRLRVPLTASWHTNVHEYAGRRLERALGAFPRKWREAAGAVAERRSLNQLVRIYRRAKIVFAPNPELLAMLESRTGRPAYLMPRGIDAAQFSPAWRDRTGAEFVIGYVGRLSTEKNVRLFTALEAALVRTGVRDYKFLIVGDGSEREWLAQNLERKELTGTLRGDPLSRAYANMDVFVFPSLTDTFGNVVLEAMASGLPAIVTNEGGPKYMVRPGVNGFLAGSAADFVQYVLELKTDRERLRRMARAARDHALGYSWRSVFEGMYRRYAEAIESGALASQSVRQRAFRKLMLTVP
jgi:glycosyltransferase involved in cell wall biosynthesis